jgi:hypothetical protein
MLNEFSQAILPLFVFFGHHNYRIETAQFIYNVLAVWPKFWSDVVLRSMVHAGYDRYVAFDLTLSTGVAPDTASHWTILTNALFKHSNALCITGTSRV